MIMAIETRGQTQSYLSLTRLQGCAGSTRQGRTLEFRACKVSDKNRWIGLGRRYKKTSKIHELFNTSGAERWWSNTRRSGLVVNFLSDLVATRMHPVAFRHRGHRQL
jgi:hypothetical protein